MAIFLLAMGTIALLGISTVKEEKPAEKEVTIERCYKDKHEKKCELRYK